MRYNCGRPARMRPRWPSCCSLIWCVIVADTCTRLRLYVSYHLESAALQVILAKIAEYTRAGFTGAGELAAAIRMGGHTA